jgi:nicotinate-nucleotide--dimethylbenzimidazole phosphoribosyltransferase
MTQKELEKYAAEIMPASEKIAEAAARRQNSLTKPPGSLGRLEECAVRYAAARGSLTAKIEKPAIVVFAGDHGVVDEGVSAFPKEVTYQMLLNFTRGGAGINVLSRLFGITLRVVDTGVDCERAPEGVADRKVARGTRNLAKGPAMSLEETAAALSAGVAEAESLIKDGSTILGTGDMGIGNTTPSSALYSAFLRLDPSLTAGRGTGLDDARLKHKIGVLEKALSVNSASLKDPFSTLAALGGFEIAGICGLIIGAAKNRIPVIVDGFISGAAACAAFALNKNISDYCFFSHLSAEAGHAAVTKAMGVRPLLSMDMRLGEGTGAALALNIIKAGVATMSEMATFGEAGVSGKS